MKLVNNTARFTHGMAILFATGCALAILAVVMQGPPDGLSQAMTWLVLGVFGTAAGGLLVYANRIAAIGIELRNDQTIIVTEQTLLTKRTRRIHRGDVRDIFVEQSEDQDGAAYLQAVVCLTDGSRFVAREGTDAQSVDEAAASLKRTSRK